MTWTKRVAPGVEQLRFRAEHRLAFITNEAELAAAAGTIEELATKLDRAYRALAGIAWLVLLAAIGVYGALN